MIKKFSYEDIVKEILQEIKEDPVYKFKLVFGIISVIPFLAFFYIILSISQNGQIFSLEMSSVLFFIILTSLCGFVWGYQTVNTLFNKIILYAAKVKRSEQLKSELVAAIAHDFKIPISVLKLSLAGAADSLKEQINEKQKDHLDSCLNILEHMLRTISTLLDLYKVEAGMVALKKEKYDIAVLLEEQLKEFKIMFDKKAIKLNQKIPKDALFGLIDRDKIAEAVYNLLSNAFKYTPEGGSVTVIAYNAADDFIRVEFSNSGRGIPLDKITTIFDKFHRLESEQEGTGLGLAIAKDIIELHEGYIWVENLADNHVKFIVVLPRYKENNHEAAYNNEKKAE